MDQQRMQYLMWLKSKQIKKSGGQLSSNSWEEEAFAEDASGPLGGFVWPPRSYSCTFCRREFRSAQALGGHMNVHRRDRARLKQSTCSSPHELHFEKPTTHHDQLSPNSTLTTQQYSPQAGHSGSGFVSYPFSPGPSAILSQESLSTVKSHICPFSSFIAKEQQRRLGDSISSPQGSDSSSVLRLVSNISNTSNSGKCGIRKEDQVVLSTVRNGEDADHVETNLSVALNFGDYSHNLQLGSSSHNYYYNSKRRKSNDIAMSSSPLLFFHKSCSSSDRFVFQSEARGLRIKPGSIEEIDLELRLGDSPAVK